MIDGERLRLRRLKLRLSQQALGKHIGQDQAYISRLERKADQMDITTTMLGKLADALGVSTDYLLGRVAEPDADLRRVPAELAMVGAAD